MKRPKPMNEAEKVIMESNAENRRKKEEGEKMRRKENE